MKKTLLISLLIFLSISSFGQKIRFSDSTNRWLWYYVSTDGSGLVFLNNANYSYDTVIHGTVYNYISLGAYVREDTILRKVFAIYPISDPSDTSEKLLYDFSLNVGDSFRNEYVVYYVSGIDSVLINTIWHKVWHLIYARSITGLYISIDNDVIEGIGSTSYPLFPISPVTLIEGGDILTCFSTNGTTPPLSHKVGLYFDNATSCSLTFGLGVNNVANRNKNASLFPNPINESSKIVLPYNITSGSLVIVNDVGQEIINMPFQNKEELLIGDQIKVPGIYCYRVRDNQSGATFSGKFVHE